MVPLYVATLTRGHPSYEATIPGNNLCIIVFNIPLTKGHHSNKARFSIPQVWPYKRGTTVHRFVCICSYWFVVICIVLNIYTKVKCMKSEIWGMGRPPRSDRLRTPQGSGQTMIPVMIGLRIKRHNNFFIKSSHLNR